MIRTKHLPTWEIWSGLRSITHCLPAYMKARVGSIPGWECLSNGWATSGWITHQNARKLDLRADSVGATPASESSDCRQAIQG